MRRLAPCDEEMCSEIHAYSRVNCNTLTGSKKIECVKRGAKASASRYKECKGGLVDVSAEIDKKVDKGECM